MATTSNDAKTTCSDDKEIIPLIEALLDLFQNDVLILGYPYETVNNNRISTIKKENATTTTLR